MTTPSTTPSAAILHQISPLSDSTEKRSQPELPIHPHMIAPAHRAYLRVLSEALSKLPPELIQSWDETRNPPLPLLRSLTSQGLLVTSVPMPAPGEAQNLTPLIARFFGERSAQQFEALLHRTSDAQSNVQFLEQVGQSGHLTITVLASMLLPQLASVGAATFLGVNSGLAAQTISKIGTPAQQSLWLNALNNGILTYGFGLTEQNIGSDPRSIETTFSKETDASGATVYRLNGNKKFIGNAARVVGSDGEVIHRGADALLVFAVDDPKKAPKDRSFRVFMVPRNLIGEENIWSSGHEHNKLGLREVNNGDFVLKDVIVPESLLIGQPDKDVYSKLVGLLDITRMFVGGMGVGAAEAAVSIARSFAAERRQNGGPIERFQLVSFPLDDFEARIEAAKLLLVHSSKLADQSEQHRGRLREAVTTEQCSLLLAREQLQHLGSGTSRDQLQELLQQSEVTLSSLAQSHVIAKYQKEFQRIAVSLRSITRTLRDSARSESERNAAKAIFKIVERVGERVAQLRQPPHFGKETAMCKLYGSELAFDATRQAMNTLGGDGYIEDPKQGRGLPKRLRDTKVLEIYEGTSNIQRNIIAAAALGEYAQALLGSTREKIKYALGGTHTLGPVLRSLARSNNETPLQVADAHFGIAIQDTFRRYRAERQRIAQTWQREGIPAEFRDFDGQSLNRQKDLLASLPIQARLGIIADMAVEYELMKLSIQQLESFEVSVMPQSECTQQIKALRHFVLLAEERILTLSARLQGAALKNSEVGYTSHAE